METDLQLLGVKEAAEVRGQEDCEMSCSFINIRCSHWGKLGKEYTGSLWIVSYICMQNYNDLKIKILIKNKKPKTYYFRILAPHTQAYAPPEEDPLQPKSKKA